MITTNPLFTGFSSSQTVDKEIILRASAYKRTMESLLSDGSFFALIGNVDDDRDEVKRNGGWNQHWHAMT